MKTNRAPGYTSMPFQQINIGKLNTTSFKNNHDFSKSQRNYNVGHYRNYLDYQKNFREKTNKLEKLKERYFELKMLQKIENKETFERVNPEQTNQIIKASQSCYFPNPNIDKNKIQNKINENKIGLSQTMKYNFSNPVLQKRPQKLHKTCFDPFQADQMKKRKKKFEHFIEKGFSDDLQNQLERLLKNELGNLENSVWDRQLLIDRNLDSLDLYLNSLKEQNENMKCNIQELRRELREHELYGEMEMKVFLKKFLLFQKSKNKTDLFYLLWDKLKKSDADQKQSKYIFPNRVYQPSKKLY